MYHSYKSYIAIIAGTIIALLAIWFVLLFFQKKTSLIADDPARLIPYDAFIVIDVNKPFSDIKVLKETVFWQELAEINYFGKADNSIVFIDSLINRSDRIKKLIEHSTLHVSFHEIRNEPVSGLCILTPDRKSNIRDVAGLLKNKLEFKEINRYEFLDGEIFEGRFPDGENIFMSFYRGSLLISYQSRLIETSITQFNSGTNVLSDKAFNELHQLSGKKSKLFFKVSNICGALDKLITYDKQGFFACSDFAEWITMDLNVYDQLLLSNGFLLAGEGQKFIPPGKPYEHALLSMMPSSVFFMISKTIDNVNDESETKPSNKKVERTGYSLFIDGLHNKKISRVLILNLDDNVLATEVVGRYNLRRLNIRDYFADEYSMSLYVNNRTSFLEDFAKFGLSDSYEYLICKGNFIMAFPDMEAVKSWYMFKKNNQTLQSNPHSKTIFEQLPYFSNYLIYTFIPDLITLMTESFTDDFSEFVQDNRKTIERFDRAAFQFTHNNNNLYQAHLVLSHNPDALNVPAKKWEVALDDEIKVKIYRVLSHVDNSKEIIVSDKSNNLYLISETGDVLWKRELPEAVMSEIYQVDYYKNNRYQYLFNTPNYIFLIDRLGRDVASYPVKLPETASSPMAVFDYDNNKNYRLLIALNNKRILNYDKTGRPVAGWAFNKSNDIVEKPVQHIRLAGKDFLFVTDVAGASKILNRRGQVRIKVPPELKVSKNNPVYFDDKPSKPYFIITGSNGHLIELTLEGAISNYAIKDFSEEHYFSFYDLNGDGEKDYIFLDKHELFVYDSSGRKLFSHKFDNAIKESPFIIRLDKKIAFVGIVDKSSEKVYMFSAEGKNQMPLVISGDLPYVIIETDKPGIIEVVKGLNNIVRSYEITF